MNEQQIQELKNLVDKLQAEGLSQDQIQAQVDAKKQEFLNVDFQTPTTPGAVVEETAAPDTELKSEDTSLGLPEKVKNIYDNLPKPLQWIGSQYARKLRKGTIGALDFTNFIGGIVESAEGAAETALTYRSNQLVRSGKITQEEQDYLLNEISDGAFAPLTDVFDEFKRARGILADFGQEDPNRTIYEEFFSDEGNFKDGIDKLENGLLQAIPSVTAAFAGPAGMAAIFTSATGEAYKRKVDVDPSKRGDAETFGWSLAQGGVELVSEMVTRGIVKGFGKTVLAPNTVKNIYKATTKNLTGRILTGAVLEGSSEVGAQEVNRYLDYIWDKDNAFGYQKINPDGSTSYDVGNILQRSFDTFLISSIVGGGLGAASKTPGSKRYTEERLSPVKLKKDNLKIIEEISKLENEYVSNPNPIIENKILELQQQVIDNKLLNERVLNSFEDSELVEYARDKIAISEARDNLNNIEDVSIKDSIEKAIEQKEQKVDEQYNSQKAIILMLNFGPNATNAEIKEGVKKSKTQKIADQINNTYKPETTNTEWYNKETQSGIANDAITELAGDYNNGPLARIIKNKITGEMSRLPDFSREDFISETVLGLIPHIRNFKPELIKTNPNNTLSGWISGFIDNKIAGVLGSKKASKEQFETEITGVQETQFDIDDATQETLDFVRTEPKAKEQLRNVVGITKESVQADAKQILKGKLPGILEKTGRDKNQILTEINKASKLKIADAVLEEMGGNFTDKQEQKSQFITFMDTNFDAVINAIPDASKNKLPLFDPQQVRRETVVEGDAAGKGVFEYKDVSRDEFIKYYTEIDPAKNPASEMNKLRAKKKGLADIIAQEIGKDAIAEVLQDPAVQKDFLERQKFLKKEIPQDAIPRLLQRIDRAIEVVDQFGKTTLQSGPIPVVPAAKVFLKSLKALIKSGVKFSEALSKAIEKFKQALKGATKEQKSLAERILNYHIKNIEDLNKLQENDLIEDLNFFMASGVLEISENDFKNENIWWTKFAKNNKIKILDSKNSTDVKRFREWTANVLPKYFGKEFVTLGTFANAGKSAAKRNFFFESIQEVENTVKNSKFQKDDADITAAVTKQVYTTGTGTKRKVQDKFKNELWGSENLKKQNAQKLKGLQKIFAKFEQMIKDDPKNKGFIMAILQSTSQSQSHFIRTSAPIKFLAKNIDGEKVVEEHTLPASLVAKYLFNSALNGKVNKNFTNIKNNYFQGLLSAKDDNKMKGKGKDNKPFNYKEVTPEGWLITDNIWARYFNINVALQDGGIMPENIILEDGKSVAEKFNINNAGYGIKGKNLNTSIIFQHKIDEANKEDAKQVYAEKDLNKEFNEFLEKSTGIGAQKVFSRAKAEARAQRVRKGFGDYFVPPSAEDFAGLMHKTLAKGKEGEKQLKFYQDNLYTPYNVANENITRERAAMFDDFRALKNKLNNIPKTLKQLTESGDFTKEQAVRVYMWNKQGMKIPGLSNADLKSLLQEVNNNKDLMQFANELLNITKGDGYAKPENNWLGGNIAIDLMSLMNSTKRSKHLEVWQNNVDQIFSKENLNKLEAAYGKSWVTNLTKTLERMKTGMNRKWGGDKVLQSYLDWVNGSVGAIMFLNTRSAVLQTISNINYLNFADNNPLKAAKAFANQKQYWSDFKTIFNSDYLQERRGGNKINVNESELALAAEKGGIQGAVSLLLNKGFIFTKIADSFAIASGGATMYRNRINTYIKDGLSEKEATEKAFIDFKAITEETQQSSRPDRISEQQASNAGRLLLAFANTPMQYNRIIKKNAQDLVAGRGNKAEKISKIIYYSTIQNLIFNAMQKALFALAFADGDEGEKEIEKYSQVANGMADSLLRGSGLTGNAVVAAKNVAIDIANRMDKPRPNFQDAAWKALTISPPIYSKVSKLRGAGYSLGYTTPENMFEPKLDNPALSAGANIISAGTNIPLDRALRKAQNIEAAMSDEAEWWQRTALLMGWGSWELGMQDNKSSSVKRNKYGERIIEERLGKEKIIKEKIIK
jgi:hypothetical protein